MNVFFDGDVNNNNNNDYDDDDDDNNNADKLKDAAVIKPFLKV